MGKPIVEREEKKKPINVDVNASIIQKRRRGRKRIEKKEEKKEEAKEKVGAKRGRKKQMLVVATEKPELVDTAQVWDDWQDSRVDK